MQETDRKVANTYRGAQKHVQRFTDASTQTDYHAQPKNRTDRKTRTRDSPTTGTGNEKEERVPREGKTREKETTAAKREKRGKKREKKRKARLREKKERGRGEKERKDKK